MAYFKRRNRFAWSRNDSRCLTSVDKLFVYATYAKAAGIVYKAVWLYSVLVDLT